MLSPDSRALGFHVPEHRDLLRKAAAASRRSPARHVPASAWCYDDASGARVYSVGGDGRTCGTWDVAYVSAPVAVSSCEHIPRQDLSASIVRVHGTVAHLDLVDGDGDLVARVLADCDDVRTIPEAGWWGTQIDLDEAVVRDTVTVSAVSVDVTVDGRDGALDAADREPSVLAASLSHLTAGDDPAKVGPFAAVAGRVLDVDLVTNELTGRQWYRTVVDVSLPVVLALPVDVSEVPRVGSWVSGYVRLCVSTGIWDGCCPTASS